jgi:hypothetical protein
MDTDVRSLLPTFQFGAVTWVRCTHCAHPYVEDILYCPNDCGHEGCELSGLDKSGRCADCYLPDDAECHVCGAGGSSIDRACVGGYFACPRHRQQVHEQQLTDWEVEEKRTGKIRMRGRPSL